MTKDSIVEPGFDSSTDHAGSLSPLAILKHSSKLSISKLVGIPVAFVISILVAHRLGPAGLGLVGYIGLWQLYGALIRPGLVSAASREMPPLIGKAKLGDAVHIQNVAISAESIYLVIPTTAFLVAALLRPDLRLLMLAGAVAFLATQVQFFVGSVAWAYQRFGLIARATVVATVAGALFTLVLIGPIGLYAAVLAPGVAALAGAIYTIRWGPPIHFNPQFDRKEMARLFRIGLPLALATIFYWGFRTVDRTAVAAWLSLQDLGYFTFVMQYINLGILLVADFGNVVQPKLWASLGSATANDLGAAIRRLSLTVLIATCAFTGLAQALFGVFVAVAVPKFVAAVPLFELLALLLAVGTAGIIPGILLNSAAVNRQRLVTILYGFGMVLNAVAVAAAVRLGMGLAGVAVASVLGQLVVSAALLQRAAPHFIRTRSARAHYYAEATVVLCVTLAISAAFRLPELTFSPSVSVYSVGLRRTAIVTAVWLSVSILAVSMRKRRPGAG